MKNLLYKEIKLSTPLFVWFLSFFAAALLLIPQWIYFIAFMYFFWVSIPQMLGSMNVNNDMSFSLLMPIQRNDYVKSKIIIVMIIGLVQIAFGAIFALVNHLIYPYGNYLLDLNFAFFGLVFILYGVFNLILFPLYFKTGYKYGLPTIIANLVVFLLATGFEILNALLPEVNNILESSNFIGWQLFILFFGVLIFVLFNYLAYRNSIKNFAGVDL